MAVIMLLICLLVLLMEEFYNHAFLVRKSLKGHRREKRSS